MTEHKWTGPVQLFLQGIGQLLAKRDRAPATTSAEVRAVLHRFHSSSTDVQFQGWTVTKGSCCPQCYTDWFKLPDGQGFPAMNVCTKGHVYISAGELARFARGLEIQERCNGTLPKDPIDTWPSSSADVRRTIRAVATDPPDASCKSTYKWWPVSKDKTCPRCNSTFNEATDAFDEEPNMPAAQYCAEWGHGFTTLGQLETYANHIDEFHARAQTEEVTATASTASREEPTTSGSRKTKRDESEVEDRGNHTKEHKTDSSMSETATD
jgi:hypothetical protein